MQKSPSCCACFCLQLTKFHQEEKAKLDAHIKPGGQRNALQVRISRAVILLHKHRMGVVLSSCLLVAPCLPGCHTGTQAHRVAAQCCRTPDMQLYVLTQQVLCNSFPGGAAALAACAAASAMAHDGSPQAQHLLVLQFAACCAFLVSGRSSHRVQQLWHCQTYAYSLEPG